MGVFLRVLAAVGLIVSAVVHLDLAATYDGIGEQITVGDLFRAQGVVGLLAAVALALRRPVTALVALFVALASTAAVVVSVYVRIPPLGPLPELFEPVWYAEKSLSAAATAVASLAATGLLVSYRRTR